MALNNKKHHPISGPFSVGTLKNDEDILIEIKSIETFDDVVWCLTRSAGILKDNYKYVNNSEYSRKMRIIDKKDENITKYCVGFVGTNSIEYMSSGRGGCHGGNLDLPCIKSGSTILLPSQCNSSDVWFGDLHYEQGWGELAGVASECSGIVTFVQKRVSLIQKTLEPIVIETIEKDIYLYFVGARNTFEEALQAATRNILRFKKAFNCANDTDMYYKIGTNADLMIGQAVAKTISLAIKIKVTTLEKFFIV